MHQDRFVCMKERKQRSTRLRSRWQPTTPTTPRLGPVSLLRATSSVQRISCLTCFASGSASGVVAVGLCAAREWPVQYQHTRGSTRGSLMLAALSSMPPVMPEAAIRVRFHSGAGHAASEALHAGAGLTKEGGRFDLFAASRRACPADAQLRRSTGPLVNASACASISLDRGAARWQERQPIRGQLEWVRSAF